MNSDWLWAPVQMINLQKARLSLGIRFQSVVAAVDSKTKIPEWGLARLVAAFGGRI